ncbi:hypothetical protein TWF102_002944 [Orbilia oligospora]|uniref:RING-type domain-containing protein n=1 Tax=Orbilia oligospora TaxID=2813651 RepID=A0A7C8MYC4_ORBOL|nr:hypothetical protein TWF102_002944 [Orbilia oligospora]KAF3084110.1 hypothetical protein TWF706_000817 [Orbilia oligospora]KAF3094942.1 hypothetical protein TWF103_010438 [Orbilia oligospora]KAF3122760.1 hypothetical protein TWF703_001152 [Orbilia oligospora]
MSRPRRGLVGSRHEEIPQPEIIDLTTSPSPPLRATTLPGRFSRRHTPYNARDRRGRYSDREQEREQERELERERDRTRRTPASRPPDAEVIDLDAIPDPPPVRQNDNPREERRPGRILYQEISAHDIEVNFDRPRVRQPSRDPFQPPRHEHNHHHHHDHHHHHHHANRAGAPPNEPPLDDLLFAPFGRLRPNIGGVASAGLSILEMVRDISMPFHRLGFFGAGSQNRASHLAPLAPLAPHRDPPDIPNFPLRNGLFQAPGRDLDWFQLPGFAAQNEVEITGQVHSKDPPIKEARKGFTRSPKSEDAIGCSMCDQELGDSDDDIKKQIWVMKCGHCYCGECANAMLSQPRAQKGRKRKYPSCAIDGCKQATTGKKFVWELYP